MSQIPTRPKILLTHPDIPKEAIDIMSPNCEIITCTGRPATRQEILQKLPGVHGLLWCTKEMLDKEVLDAAGQSLLAISTMSAGLDNVDLPEIRKRNIPIGYTPGVLNNAVADLTVGLIISTARRFVEASDRIAKGTWGSGPAWFLGQNVSESTVGIVGLGEIGQAVAKRLKAFSMTIIYTGHNQKPEGDELGAQFVTMNELLERSDFVVVTCPLTSETRGMFDAEKFAKMKKTACFINVSRGAIVNQNDLVNALTNKTIYAAGLDVMTPEPLPQDHPLLKLPNCTLLPHIGSATKQTRIDMATIATYNILQGISGENMFAPVPK
uniref:Glyoxylate reductase/hydroxypyruvate reductase n=1 Tax=Xenopsylla cheopis TaxID=163159 RepID=A0A6M2DNW2_XENCH